MKCPKCGGEIPAFDLRPNCKHCGVNIMYFTQQEGLIRDAKRTELEGAAARMIIARVKAEFIGSKLAVLRMVFSILAAAALLVPFITVKFNVPLFDGAISVGLIGLIQGFQNGLLMKTPQLLGSVLFAKPALAALIPAAFLAVVAVLDLVILGALIVGFLNLTKSARVMKITALIGVIVSLAAHAAVILMKVFTPDTATAQVSLFPGDAGGAAVCFIVFLILFFLNREILKRGIEPVYRENDIKRREILKQVRAGKVDLDSLSLPVLESEEEREERMKALEEALKAEEEGKEL